MVSLSASQMRMCTWCHRAGDPACHTATCLGLHCSESQKGFTLKRPKDEKPHADPLFFSLALESTVSSYKGLHGVSPSQIHLRSLLIATR